MTTTTKLVSWVLKQAAPSVTKAARSAAFGTPDERALEAALADAVVAVASDLVDDVEGAKDAADALRHLTHAYELSSSLTSRPRSVTEAMSQALEAQLAGLFEHRDDHGQTHASSLGIRCSLAELVDSLVRSTAGSVPFHSTADAVGALALHQEALRHDGSPAILLRYYVFRSFDALVDLVEKRLDRLPFPAHLLVQNDTLEFWASLVLAQRDRYRDLDVHTGSFVSAEEYLAAHPETRVLNDDREFPGWATHRPATVDDVAGLSALDGITRLLAEEGVAPSELAELTCTDLDCGDDPDTPFHETAHLRPVWGLLLQIKVLEPTVLRSLTLNKPTQRLTTLTEAERAQRTTELLPEAYLDAGESVLVPLATMLPELAASRESWWHQVSEEVLDGERYSTLNVASVCEQLQVWGPARFPVEVVANTARVEAPSFDPTRMFAVDRSWTMGSCPHVFFVHGDGSPRYRGPVFGRGQRREQVVAYEVPPGCNELIIAELEEEATYLRRVVVGGVEALAYRWLSNGESVTIAVSPGQVAQIRGYYVADPRSTTRRGMTARTNLVRRHLRHIDRSPVSTYRS